MRAKVPIYNTGEGARGWWKNVSRCLRSSGLRVSVREPSLFYLRDGEGLVGMCTVHVDDILCAGGGKHYDMSMAVMKGLVYSLTKLCLKGSYLVT